MTKAWSPTGSQILGTLERLSGRAEIIADSYRGDPKTGVDFDWEGGTEIFYDDQETVTRDGQRVFLDEAGDSWAEDQLALADEPPTVAAPEEAARVQAVPGPAAIEEKTPTPWSIEGRGDETAVVDKNGATVLLMPWDGKPVGDGGVNDALLALCRAVNGEAAPAPEEDAAP